MDLKPKYSIVLKVGADFMSPKKMSVKGYLQIILFVFMVGIFSFQNSSTDSEPILFALNKMTYLMLAFLAIIYLEVSKKK